MNDIKLLRSERRQKVKVVETQTGQAANSQAREAGAGCNQRDARKPAYVPLLLVCVCALGCPKSKAYDVTGQTRHWEEKPNVDLTHDFGLLRPAETVMHSFVIHNDSTITWTLAQIQNHCACTAGRPKGDKI